MKYDLEIERKFAAKPDEVFRAWTDADEISRWYKPVPGWVTEAKVDLRVGGSYRFAFGPRGGDQYVETGEYLEIEPPNRLVYTLSFEGRDDTFETVVAVDFKDDESGTKVVVSERGYPTEEIRDRHESGWGKFLNNLEGAVTGRSRD